MPGPPRVRRERGRYPQDRGGRVAVIMAAYRATEWILNAVESVNRQLAREGWEYELRIGVDGCEPTSELLLQEGVAHWFSPTNVGPYLIRNSLIELEHVQAYAPFDADDVMKRSYLRECLAWIGRRGIAGAGRTQINPKGRIIKRRARFQGGVCVISHHAWTVVGGYRPWRMAADHDLIMRARKLRVPIKNIRQPLYYRRVHPESLTQHPDTALGSDVRNEIWERSKNLIRIGRDLQITPRLTELERREP